MRHGTESRIYCFCLLINHCNIHRFIWHISRDILKELVGNENLAIDNVPVVKCADAGVGCNRDAVGWGCNRDAVGWGIETMPHPINNYEDNIMSAQPGSPTTAYGLTVPSGIYFEYSQTDIPAQ